MRNFFLLIIPLFLFSCSSKKFERQMVSEDGKVKLTLTAIQRVPLDPYTTVIHVEGYGHSENLPFELYNTNLTEEDVLMQWSSNQEGVLRLKETDGKVREFKLFVSEDRLMLKE